MCACLRETLNFVCAVEKCKFYDNRKADRNIIGIQKCGDVEGKRK